MNTRLPGALLAAVLTAQPAWAQGQQRGHPQYPRELRGAWMLGDHPGCRAADVPGNASDLLIGARQMRTLEARHALLALRRTGARRWHARERVADGVQPQSTVEFELQLSGDGRRLTRFTGPPGSASNTDHFTRCR